MALGPLPPSDLHHRHSVVHPLQARRRLPPDEDESHDEDVDDLLRQVERRVQAERAHAEGREEGSGGEDLREEAGAATQGEFVYGVVLCIVVGVLWFYVCCLHSTV